MLPTQANLCADVSAVMEIAARPDLVFMSGRGSWLKDQAGKTYLDFVQGWAVNSLGHCPSVITGALILQSSRLINCSPAFFNAPMAELAKVLADASGLEKVFFANSGAEANEGAIKLARKWGARYRGGAFEIITMEHGFHGRTLACMAASGKAAWENLFAPKVPGFRKVPLNDLDAVGRALSPNTVAVMLEPVQGEAGVYPATLDYLRALRKLTKDAGVLLILDEVQTGVGRTGRMFDFENAGIVPDIMTLGKGLGGGVPLAALLARETVACFEHGDQGGTFNGNPLTTSVGIAVVQEVLKPGFLESVVAHGNYMTRKLETLSLEHGLGEIRGRGLLLALDTGSRHAPLIVEHAREAGLLLNAPRPHVLRFMPALNVTMEEIDHMVSILGGVLRSGRSA